MEAPPGFRSVGVHPVLRRVRWIRPGFLLAVVVLLTVVGVAPSAGLQAEYEELEAAFEEGDLPDSSALVTLPTPRTAREYWLRSRVQPDFPRAREDLREAIELSGDPAVRERFLEEWIQLSLLADDVAGAEGLAFLADQFDQLRREGHSPERLWLLGARFARAEDDRKRAHNWLERAAEASDLEIRQTARLNLAELVLQAGKLERARQLLDDYFLEASDGTAPEYWLLRGRLFEREGADSEAYVAYSHVVNEYPRSMVLTEAERRMNALPVPDAVIGGDSPPAGEPAGIAPSDTGTADTSAPFRIQVGSFAKRSLAVDLRDRLAEALDRRVVVTRGRVENRTYHRVQVLGFSSRAEAEQALDGIEEQGFEGFVIQP